MMFPRVAIALSAVVLLTGAAELTAPGTGSGIDLAPPGAVMPDERAPGAFASGVSGELRAAQGPEAERRVAALRRIVRHELARNGGAAQTGIKANGAMLTLGLLHYHGVIVERDVRLARDLFFRAFEAGSRPAALAAAWCLAIGCGDEPNIAGLERLLPQAKRVDAGRAAYIQYIAAQQTGADEATVTRLLARAVQLKDRYALNAAGLNAVENDNLARAIDLFDGAAAQGSPAGAHNAALAMQQQRSAGDAHRDSSASTGQTSAAMLFAQARKIHQSGKTPSDYSDALRLYQEAAGKGSEPARQMLALILSRPAANGTINVIWMRQTAHVMVGPAGNIGAGAVTTFQQEASALTDLIPAVFLRQR